MLLVMKTTACKKLINEFIHLFGFHRFMHQLIGSLHNSFDTFEG